MGERTLARDLLGANFLTGLAPTNEVFEAVTKQVRLFETMNQFTNPLRTLAALEGSTSDEMSRQIAAIHEASRASSLATH